MATGKPIHRSLWSHVIQTHWTSVSNAFHLWRLLKHRFHFRHTDPELLWPTMLTEQDVVLTTQTKRDFHLQSSGVAELIQHVLDAAVAIHIQNGPIMNHGIVRFLVPLAYRSAVPVDASNHQIILAFCVQGLNTPGFPGLRGSASPGRYPTGACVGRRKSFRSNSWRGEEHAIRTAKRRWTFWEKTEKGTTWAAPPCHPYVMRGTGGLRTHFPSKHHGKHWKTIGHARM